jgi:hypothetical protein
VIGFRRFGELVKSIPKNPHGRQHTSRADQKRGNRRTAEPLDGATKRLSGSVINPLGLADHPRSLAEFKVLSNKPLIRIYQQHDYAAEVKAAFEKWSEHVEALVSEPLRAAA